MTPRRVVRTTVDRLAADLYLDGIGEGAKGKPSIRVVRFPSIQWAIDQYRKRGESKRSQYEKFSPENGQSSDGRDYCTHWSGEEGRRRVQSASHVFYSPARTQVEAQDSLYNFKPLPKVRKVYEKCLDSLMADPEIYRIVQSAKRKRIYHNDGEDLNHERYYSGHELALSGMVRKSRVRTVRLGIHLVTPCAACGWLGHDYEERGVRLAQMGAYAVAAARILTEAGYPVELFAGGIWIDWSNSTIRDWSRVDIDSIRWGMAYTRVPLPTNKVAEDTLLSLCGGLFANGVLLGEVCRPYFHWCGGNHLIHGFGEGYQYAPLCPPEILAATGVSEWVRSTISEDGAKLLLRQVLVK